MAGAQIYPPGPPFVALGVLLDSQSSTKQPHIGTDVLFKGLG
jgi:hypothetical protein